MPNTELLKVTSEYSPAGDQPQAIEEIVKKNTGESTNFQTTSASGHRRNCEKY